ncbi:MAG: DUF898 domain-containing protein [Nitrospirae bacterium]|nr:DUF898 domain-containing protein [Nitrospirota bacterium]
MDNLICKNCGLSTSKVDLKGISHICPGCGSSLETEVYKKENGTDDIQMQSEESRLYYPRFTGSANEYFKIWIVNTFLTIITLGIYAAWAKVRNRQYIYKNTLLDDQPFEYTANPVAILKGNLIVASGAIIYFLTYFYKPMYSAIVVGLFYLILPFLIFKSLKFIAHNSAYRNIRFRFLGNMKESYRIYIFYPILILFTLGLIIPYWAFKKKEYFFNNFAFGATANSFNGKAKRFYKIYLSAFVIFIISILILGFIFFTVLIKSGLTSADVSNKSFIMKNVIIAYALMIVVVTYFQQFIYARITNYCWEHSNLGSLRFRSTLKAGTLFFIRITNILAIILSIGLLIPWAKIRKTRYILNNITIMSEKELDDFKAFIESDVSAYGVSATEAFDFDIGL